jgi:tetratricopeptide (TPR) repeat protein
MTLRAQGLFLRLGNHLGQGLCLNALAEVSRKQGDLDGAEAGYRQALARYEAVGAANALFPRLNLALVLLQRRRFDEARALLEQALVTVTRSGRRGLQGCIHANLLPCAAAEADWMAWDHHLEQATELLGDSGLLEEDIAWPACLAGDLAWEQNQAARAQAAWRLAHQQWSGLNNQERLAQVEALLQRHPA